jgi:hypothetical protein
MSYSINRYNGTSLGTILDGTVDTSHTSLTLIGRNYANYGQIMVSNLVNLLENFSRSYEPSNPISGQLWWDSGNNLLKVYTGTGFKIISSATSSLFASPPSNPVQGDIWWATDTKQLYVWDGVGSWILVGPGYSAVKGKSGAIFDTVIDTGATSHDVVKLFLNGVVTGIWSKDPTFTSNGYIPGFTTISPGLNMGTTYNMWGTANNASYLGAQPAANYVRKDIDQILTGAIAIANDTGANIGITGQLQFSLSGTDASITNKANGGDINILATVGGVTNRYIYINGGTGEVEVAATPTSSLGIATKSYVDGKFVNTILTGIPVAPTAPQGTSNTMLATTEFVSSGLSGLYPNKIYQLNSKMEILDTGAGTANLAIDNVSVMTATSAGVNLLNGATAVTQAQTYSSSGDTAVATTAYVRTAGTWWGNSTHRSAKFVSTSAPNPGVNDIGSNDGDFWFQYTP